MPHPLERLSRLLLLGATALLPAAVHAQAPASAPAARERDWEGALGLILGNGPEYSGGDKRTTKLTPGFYLQWGRLSITNAGGFVTRRNDEVVRGLGIDMVRRDEFRLSLGLRFDSGRRESSSDDLRGLGDVKHTIRARIAATWRPDPAWRFGAAWSVDAFGRGGGNFGDFSAAREFRLTPDSVWTLGTSVALGGDRYLQTYYGVSAEQSARSGLPRYEPSAGLRDVSISLGQRTQFGRHWVLLGGVSATRLLGPAADSPLTRRAGSVAASVALAYNF